MESGKISARKCNTTIHGGSSFATNAHRTINMKNGMPSTQRMAKASGGGMNLPKTGFLNKNLVTGPSLSTLKEPPNGVILMDDASMPSRTRGKLVIFTMMKAGRLSMMQMEEAHGGGMNTQKNGLLSLNQVTGL